MALTNFILIAHIAVLGYWLGAEFVINSTYRFVCYRDEIDLASRTRLMEHVMGVDQHVRYALVLQTGLGLMLATAYGYVPGGNGAVLSIGFLTLVWLGFVELVHRLRHRPLGQSLAAIDRALRYVLMIILSLAALGWLHSMLALPNWLRWKFALFAAVILCGVAIRFVLMTHFSTWAKMLTEGASAQYNAAIQATYVRATRILLLLWLGIAGMVVLSVVKPG